MLWFVRSVNNGILHSRSRPSHKLFEFECRTYGFYDGHEGMIYYKFEGNSLTDEFVVPKLVITQIFITLSHIRKHLLENGHF